jgi:C4-dicarboxylate-specific signal transduction histidine kinase
MGVIELSFDVAAVVILWTRRRCVLDYWLLIAMTALIAQQTIGLMLNTARFSLGFYAGRVFLLWSSAVILVLLLQETTRLYARLARSNLLLERERNNRLMNIEAITASIAHQMKQPLTAIAANSDAALALLERNPPDIAEAKAGLRDIVDDTHHASVAVDAIHTLVQRAGQAREPIDMNEVVLEVLQSMRGEFIHHEVTARSQLMTQMPLIPGNRNQLQQVIVNLIHNAVEAMAATNDRRRELQMKTNLRGRHAIELTVQDSGPGIDPAQLDGIFDVFVTTKVHGTGLGLAICRTIIEKHGGQLTASSDGRTGAAFEVVLPIEPPAGSVTQAG